jgi:hypothetical protein
MQLGKLNQFFGAIQLLKRFNTFVTQEATWKRAAWCIEVLFGRGRFHHCIYSYSDS